MDPPTEPDDFDVPAQTLRGRVAGVIERICIIIARCSVPLFVPVGCLLFMYAVGGYVAVSLEIWSPSYEFLSLSEDIYFAWLGFLSGTVVCTGTGSLIGLALLAEGEGRIHSEVSVLFSFIAFGFGAGVVRMTYMIVLSSLT